MLFKKCMAPAVAGAPRARAGLQVRPESKPLIWKWRLFAITAILAIIYSASSVGRGSAPLWHAGSWPGQQPGETRTLCLSNNKLVKIVRSHFRYPGCWGGEFPSPQLWCPLMKVKIFSGPRQNKSALKNSFFIVSFYKTIYLIVRTINLNYVFLF